MAERPVLDTYGRPRGLAFPTASEQAQGARNPAVHVQAGLLLGQCMHRELLGTDGGADGRHGASPSEGAMAPAGRHADCCSDRRGAGASRMADPHGACRKARCLAVCGDWGPPQNVSGRISALVDMPIIPLGGIPCGREPASATLFIQRFPNRFPPCGQAREIWKRMSAKLRRLHGLDLLFEPAI